MGARVSNWGSIVNLTLHISTSEKQDTSDAAVAPVPSTYSTLLLPQDATHHFHYELQGETAQNQHTPQDGAHRPLKSYRVDDQD